MTAYAYAQAAMVPGLQALEISVCRTADGVLVCSHDPTTERLTSQSYVIAEETWATLSQLTVSARETTDTDQPARPFTRFEEVVERYLDTHVLFVEPKVREAAAALMQRMAEAGQPERVVWKQPVNSRLFAQAKQHGFASWGYVLDEPAHLGDNLRRFAASSDIDMLGARHGSSRTTGVVAAASRANGKSAVMWPIYTPEHRAEALSLGFRGLMTSDVVELLAG